MMLLFNWLNLSSGISPKLMSYTVGDETLSTDFPTDIVPSNWNTYGGYHIRDISTIVCN